jgi:diaminopimelate decarboxylase
MQTPRFLTPELVHQIAQNYETPVYVYSEKELRDRAREFMDFPSAFGHTVRYAMKANSQRNILKIFESEGLSIDASSDFEALRALAARIPAEKIQISSQELGKHAHELIEKGVFFVATSLHQLEWYGKNFPEKSCGIRVNPGVGSGAFAKISTGGRSSSFGIWYEKLEEVQDISEKYNITLTKLHFHIGSENSPEGWVASAEFGFPILEKFSTITHFDM